jgi:hypothetical protein
MPFVLIATLTEAGVDQVDVRRRRYRIWDKEMRELCVCIFPNGRKIYELMSDHGRHMSLGHHPMITPAAARRRARRYLSLPGNPNGRLERKTLTTGA